MTKPTLTRAQEEFLAYLQHEKAQMLQPGVAHKMLDEVIASHREVNVKLYRSCTETEYQAMRLGNPINSYQSFTTNLPLAKQWAKQPGRLVVTVESAVAFNYGAAMIAMYESMDKGEYDSSDGDFMVKSLREEAEWIAPFGSCYKPLIGRQRFEML